jgi:hypothetical protein
MRDTNNGYAPFNSVGGYAVFSGPFGVSDGVRLIAGVYNGDGSATFEIKEESTGQVLASFGVNSSKETQTANFDADDVDELRVELASTSGSPSPRGYYVELHTYGLPTHSHTI